MKSRIYKALILNDYPDAHYAEWVKIGLKTIETRMNRLFSYRGDIVICCGKTNSIGNNKGKALCIVNIWKGRPMRNTMEEILAAKIGFDENRKCLLLKDWRHFNRDFEFAPCAINKNFQGIFSIELPEDIEIIPRPDFMPFNEPIEQTLFTSKLTP